MKNNKVKDRQEALVAVIHHQDNIPEKATRFCKGRILTIFNINMKDSQMQRPMPSKPALIVKITLQQVTMTNVQCQDLVLPSMCPATRTNTTVDLCPEKNYNSNWSRELE
jgi:hypothetical protein